MHEKMKGVFCYQIIVKSEKKNQVLQFAMMILYLISHNTLGPLHKLPCRLKISVLILIFPIPALYLLDILLIPKFAIWPSTTIYSIYSLYLSTAFVH